MADENGEEAQMQPMDFSLKPQKLPMETIMEENSVLHKEKKAAATVTTHTQRSSSATQDQ